MQEQMNEIEGLVKRFDDLKDFNEQARDELSQVFNKVRQD